MNPTTSFKAALSFSSRSIAVLCSKIEQQKQSLECIRAILPEEIAKHALHCVIKDKKLLIYTDTAAWASQLRFYNRAILAAIAPITRASVSIMQVKIQQESALTARRNIAGVESENTQTTASGRKPNIPSADKIRLIHDHSLTIPDEKLQQALQRLSATLEKLSGEHRSQPD
ncbi:MAG: DciA family protein [Methylobacter sp.]